MLFQYLPILELMVEAALIKQELQGEADYKNKYGMKLYEKRTACRFEQSANQEKRLLKFKRDAIDVN